MAAHVKTLAILRIIYGALGILFALVLLMIFTGVAGITLQEDILREAPFVPVLIGSFGLVIVGLVLLISVPSVIAGLGLLRFHNWARILTLVLSAIDLLNFPVGTALGAYGFYALMANNAGQLFEHGPVYAR